MIIIATIKDVAKLSGVTVTTVSRVLNNRGYISEATKKKVFDAMVELNYVPNEVARSLYRKKSNILGLIIPDISHPFFAELSKSIELYAYKQGYKILLCNSYQDSIKERDYIEMLKKSQVDGIIMGSHSLQTHEYSNTGLPIVAIDRNLSDSIPVITSDNYQGGYLATNLLIDKGCKKLVHISGPLELNTPANKRHTAFIDITTEKNIDRIVIESKLDTFEGYKKIISDLITNNPDIDGIFASSDIIAAAAINISYEMNIQIPEKLKIIGFDNIKVSEFTTPTITTVRQPIDLIGKSAIENLIAQIHKEEVSLETILPVELIERRST